MLIYVQEVNKGEESQCYFQGENHLVMLYSKEIPLCGNACENKNLQKDSSSNAAKTKRVDELAQPPISFDLTQIYQRKVEGCLS